MKPTLLILTTTNWVPTARLAVGLADAGFRVEAVCPPNHPMEETAAVCCTHSYRGLSPLRSFFRAISGVQPEIVVPGDDLAAEHLHELYRRREEYSTSATMLESLLQRSLGSPESFPIMQSRAAFMELAQDEGIRVPKTEVLNSVADVDRWTRSTGLPSVLKADRTSGGEGVRIVRTVAEGKTAFRKLHAAPLLARALKRAVVDHDTTLLLPSLFRRRPAVSGHSFVVGHEATSTVACWKGTVLASLHFEVLRKCSDVGHATVVRLIENAEMSTAVEKMVQRMGLSGLCGFDFMLEASSRNAYLIEVNPRATQVGHLTLGAGRDLPAALYGAVTGQSSGFSQPVTNNGTIALFPHEWARDPQSEFLRTGYHDVPWNVPGLVHACIRRSKKQSTWYSREHATRDVVAANPVANVPVENCAAAATRITAR